MSAVTIADQIRAVQREIAMRETNYPKWVQAKRMKQEQADHEIAAMKAVLATVVGLGAAAEAEQRQGSRILANDRRWREFAPRILRFRRVETQVPPGFEIGYEQSGLRIHLEDVNNLHDQAMKKLELLGEIS